MAHQNGRIPDAPYDASFSSRGDDRDRELRRASHDREYPGSRERGRDTWRDDDRYERSGRHVDQRFDYTGEDRGDRWSGSGDRGWSGSDRFSESDRSPSERPYRSYDRDDRHGMRGDIPGYRASDLDRMHEDDDRYRGRRDDYTARDRGDRNAGRPFQGSDDRMSGPRDYGRRGDQAEWGVQLTGHNRVQVAGQGAEPSGTGQLRRGPHYGKGPVGFQRSDERIKETVCEALTDHGDIDASHIEISVKAGEVTLAGTVEDRRAKRLAEDCVEAVPGVKDVHNQLRIGEPAAAADKHEKSADRTEHADKKHRSS